MLNHCGIVEKEKKSLNMKQKNRCLNLMKGIGCIGVVFIHITFPGEIGKLAVLLSRYVVPFFFLIAGYYAYGTDIEENHSKIIRRAKRIFKILIYSLIPYVIYNFFYPVPVEITPALFLRIFFLSDFLCVNAAVLWYLHAQILGYLFMDFVNQKQLYPKVYGIVPIALLVCTFMRAVTTTTCYYNNVFLVAIPYMLIGHYIAQNEKKIKKVLNNKIIVAGILFGILFMGMRRFLPILIDISYVGAIMYAVGMFLFAIFNSQFSICKPLEIIGEKYSLYIYVLHILINNLLYRFFYNPWLYPIVVVLATLLVAILIQDIILPGCKKLKRGIFSNGRKDRIR